MQSRYKYKNGVCMEADRHDPSHMRQIRPEELDAMRKGLPPPGMIRVAACDMHRVDPACIVGQDIITQTFLVKIKRGTSMSTNKNLTDEQEAQLRKRFENLRCRFRVREDTRKPKVPEEVKAAQAIVEAWENKRIKARTTREGLFNDYYDSAALTIAFCERSVDAQRAYENLVFLLEKDSLV